MGYPDFDLPDPIPSQSVVPTPPRRDLDVYRDIVARLDASLAFDRVIFASPEMVDTAVAAEATVAVVIPMGGEEWMDSGPKRLKRVGRYHLIVKARQEEFADGQASAEALGCLARNALAMKPLADFCVPQFTTLQQDSFDNAGHPDASVGFHGSFLYIVRPFSGGYKAD